ncbi:MAG: hypothetical protein ACTSWY_08475, partial [Promethearchaeota archaeon]
MKKSTRRIERLILFFTITGIMLFGNFQASLSSSLINFGNYENNLLNSSSTSITEQEIEDLINYTAIEEEILKTQSPVDEEWRTETIQMLIIVRDEAHTVAMAPLAEWKINKGVPTKIINSS